MDLDDIIDTTDGVDCPKGKKKRKYNPTVFPQLMTRTSPFTLVNSFNLLTNRQKEAIKELGFDQILRLSIIEIPSRLSYWVVDNFDVCSCELVLDKGRSLQIEPVDVRRVFGFPIGNILIEEGGKKAQTDLVEEYTNTFDGKIKIGQKDIVEKMLGDKEGGGWFKRHFVMLLVSSLIENSSHGYVNPEIMQHLGNLDKVKGMDWCTYTLDCLARTKRSWENNKHKAFLGSALFLMVS